MKIATFNVNSIRARMPIVLEWLQKNQPSVLAVQETKVQDSEFPVEPIAEAGYRVYYSGQKGYNGVALISRDPLEDVISGFQASEPADSSRLIRARLGRLHIVNTYVPQGQSTDSDVFLYKLQWFDRLKSLFQQCYSIHDPIIWLGDLNVAPEPKDVYDPIELEGHVCFNPKLTDVFRNVMAWGLIDIFRARHPDPGFYTFFDYRMPASVPRNRGWRIDHILATEPVMERLIDVWIDMEPRKSKIHKPSDHTVLVCEVDDGIL